MDDVPGAATIGPAKAGKRLTLTLPPFAAARVARIKSWWRAQMQDPKQRPRTLRHLYAAAGVLTIAAGTGLYFAFRPVPQPDYATGALDDVFNYTLLTDEFNNLPVEERLKLITQLVQRLKNMNGTDSMLLAGFASGIAGSARSQIEENAARLAVDTWDKYAKDYAKVPEEAKGEYLDQTFLSFVKMMEAIGGEPRDTTDEKRLEDVRKQAQRDKAQMADGNRAPTGKELGRVFTFMDRNIGGRSTPEKRQRGMLMMRDMVRHFRGQDASTGKPPGGG